MTQKPLLGQNQLKPITDKIVARFWAKVRKTPTCWLWEAAQSSCKMRYGWFRLATKQMVKAHRMAWIIAHGSIPAGMCVLHECDVPLCVRLDHLFLGTRLDNSRDRSRKGREPHLHGARNGQAKLKPAQVKAIRADITTAQCSLARKYGVGEATISRIKTGKSWRET